MILFGILYNSDPNKCILLYRDLSQYKISGSMTLLTHSPCLLCWETLLSWLKHRIMLCIKWPPLHNQQFSGKYLYWMSVTLCMILKPPPVVRWWIRIKLSSYNLVIMLNSSVDFQVLSLNDMNSEENVQHSKHCSPQWDMIMVQLPSP